MQCLRNRVITYFCAAFLLLVALYCPIVAGQTPPSKPATGRTLHVWKESSAPAKPYASKESGAHLVQDALQLAKPGDTVLVHGDCNNATGRCTYQEDLIVDCGVTLRGDGTLPAIPILDGGGKRVISGKHFSCPEKFVTTVSRFEIQNGKTDSYGGAIFFLDRRARIMENCIHDNQAARGGGIAILLRDNSLPRPVVTISGNLIENNRATERGGAATIEGRYANPSKIKDWHATFDGNTVRYNKVISKSGSRGGGGLDVFRSRVRARNNLFDQNTILDEGEIQSYGGHVAVMNLDENSIVEVATVAGFKYVNDLEPEQFLSEGNIYRSGGKNEDGNIRAGGAIAVVWNASARMLRDWFIDNHANTGGAVYVNVRSLLEIDASHFDNNVAQGDGGAAYVVCGSRVDVNGDNMLENNKAFGRSDVGGDRLEKKGWPTPYPRGGGALFIRNSQAYLRGRNIIRKNKAIGLATGTVGFGGGLFLWQVDKGLLFREFLQSRAELEALMCNCLTYLSIRGDNLFEENLAENEGGGIAILLEQDNLGITQSVASPVLGIERAFERSEILDGTQMRGNQVENDPTTDMKGAGGIYYHDSLLPGARQPGNSKWAKGQAIIRGTLVEANQGWGLKIVDTGMHLANGRLEWLSPALEVTDSVIKANSDGGIQMWSSWPRVVGNRLLSNGGDQIYVQSTPHLPIFFENDLDGGNVSEVGVSVISAPADGTSPAWTNRLEQNNLVRHKQHAAELTLNQNSLHMERNYWGANGVVVDSSSPNSISGSILTQPPLTAAVNVAAISFRKIEVKINHPSAPPIPECRGIQRPPGVPEEPPRRPSDVPTVPTQPQSVPRATPSPLQPAPTPDRPTSVPDRTPTPQPTPSPQSQPSPAPDRPTSVPERTPPQSTPSPSPQPSPSPGQTETPPQQPAPNEWSFSVPADQVAPSTLSAENFCSRRHRFEMTLQDLPFIRLLGQPTFEVAAGRVHIVPVEIDSRGLAPGEYRGVVTMRCISCSREVGCSQDRTLIPVRMIVKARD